ncbi:hypothetical protein FOD75_10750 (plasmid) [Limosilactobacillus reuteri]|uniref:Uncharacterized protein n=1 Tax=Limosilactobacillus reuteri TaxID=1598 RepID=A0A517D895_LIMRT|nr:hypothetical protein [Limosilactobacillus reuteri]QDR73570.1 hypothetical protein FOD75_10750 [Limosilactobacillus reuteri]
MTRKEFIAQYSHDIFQILLAFGYTRAECASLIEEYKLQIDKWAGDRPSAGPILTEAMAARMIRQQEHAKIGENILL